MARVLVVLLLAAALAGVAEAKRPAKKKNKCNPKSDTSCCRDKKKTCKLTVLKKPEKCGLKAFRSKCREACNNVWAGQVENIWEKAICASAEYKDSEYCPMTGPFCTATCQETWWDGKASENKNSWWYGRASPISKGGCMKKAPATFDTPKRYPGLAKYKNTFDPSDVSCVCDTFEDGIKLKDVPKLSRTTGFCQKKEPEYDGLGKAIKRCRTMHVGLSGRGEPGRGEPHSDGEILCAGDYEYCTYNLSPPPPSTSPSPPPSTSPSPPPSASPSPPTD
jgi:hypothetical protein